MGRHAVLTSLVVDARSWLQYQFIRSRIMLELGKQLVDMMEYSIEQKDAMLCRHEETTRGTLPAMELVGQPSFSHFSLSP